jgi:putative transposase
MVAKKSQGLGTVALKRAAVDSMGGELSVRRQCDLLGISRRAFYYKPQGESKMNLGLMKRIDRIHLERPFMGTRMMTDRLCLLGFVVNRKRVRRLMRKMGIQSLAPGPQTSRPGTGMHHKVYPYLLRGRKITGPDQAWCTDITYIPMDQGYMYLVAIMDWWSRSVLSWRLSNTMDVEFCLEALQSAVDQTQRVPLIFNTDQGSQFTSMAFTGALRTLGVAVSMDGRGRYLDNIFIERLWRSFKTEEIYLKDYSSIAQLHEGTEDWFRFYNTERPHRSLNRQVPHYWYNEPNRAGAQKPDWSDLEAIKTFWS